MKKITIVGGGTAGLISALMLRKAFPRYEINLIASSKIGIVGVGEGSTEHWRWFMEVCDIPLAELLIKARATHKYGIRFENWTNHTPDYFHSISYSGIVEPFGFYGLYNGLIKNKKTLTENISSRGLIENKIDANNPHLSVNQFHFDTFKLNEYFLSICSFRNIRIIDSEVIKINLDPENGYIDSVFLEDLSVETSDFWIDATGLQRKIISEIEKVEWNSFSEYLQMDSAIAFPTESDPSGEIRPYTRARAMKNGWVWEIPTQDRRGNGYVYSSRHCTDEQAIEEVSNLLNRKVEPARSFRFDPGHIKKFWIKNCVAVGLSSSFVEPLEATSIGSTIQQIKCLIQNLGNYDINSKKLQENYNKQMNIMMENILAMISLHYVSDRVDSSMWLEQKNMKKPEYLQNLLEIWAERPPFQTDIGFSNYEMFLVPHFYHVAQGQGVLSAKRAEEMIQSFAAEESVHRMVLDAKLGQTAHAKVDHAQALKELQI